MISKAFAVLALSPLVAAAEFTALEYRNPGLAVELKAGFASPSQLNDINGGSMEIWCQLDLANAVRVAVDTKTGVWYYSSTIIIDFQGA